MSFRTKQKFSITGFYPCFARVEVKKKDKVTFEEKDLTLSSLPKPELFKLGKIVESGNVSKLEKVNTIIRSGLSGEFGDVQEPTTTTEEKKDVENAE